MKPNVIFIMTDQQRFDTIGCDGQFYYPNMEKLRSQSIMFSNFFVSAMPCVPSRACFLFGRNAWDLHMHGNSRFIMEDSQTGPLESSWMQILRNDGYASVSIGKTHLIHQGSYPIQVPLGNSFSPQSGWDHFHVEPSEEPDESFFDIHVARRTCDALEVLKDDGPFAMFVGFHAPHEPYVLPEKYIDFCKPDDIVLPNQINEDKSKWTKSHQRRIKHFENMFGSKIHNSEDIRKGIAGYYCSLKMIDDCIGRIMNKLDSLNLSEKTIVIFTSDHGEMLGEHSLFNKNATAYEAEIHVPFMIRLPGCEKAGMTVKNLGCAIDFFPTLMDILNIDPDLPLPGYSLLKCVENGISVRDNVLIWHSEDSLTLRCPDAKLVFNPADEDGELYNLADDPHEINNLWSNPEASLLKSEMITKMLKQRLLSDQRAGRLTKKERRLHAEVRSSKEPEVIN